MESRKIKVFSRIAKAFCAGRSNFLDRVFTNIRVKRKTGTKLLIEQTEAINGFHVISGWCQKGTFNFTEIVRNHSLKQGAIYYIVRFIFHFY